MKKVQEHHLWRLLKVYFNALPNRESEEQTIAEISQSIVFRGSNLWVLIFAILIASLGLNVNSTAVIIGAMLISPLMGPITGMGLGIGISDLDLLKRSIKNYGVATVISVLTATLYFSITPLTEAQSELLARTSPTLYDVLIALFGGAAGILALSTKGKGNVIPGVAIATALMPPLCTAGYGLAMGNASYFFGAFYLFFINTVFICLSTYLGVRMLKFNRKAFIEPERMKKVKRYITAIVVLTLLPATYMTFSIIQESIVDNSIQKFVKNELTLKGTQIISQMRDEKKKTINIIAIGKTIDLETIERAEKTLEKYELESYKLNVIQGTQSDSLLLLQSGGNNSLYAGKANKDKLVAQSRQIHQLENQLKGYTQYEKLSEEIRTELQAISPTVSKVVLSKVSETKMDTTASQQYLLAVINTRTALAKKEQEVLEKWLKARAKTDSLRLIVLP